MSNSAFVIPPEDWDNTILINRAVSDLLSCKMGFEIVGDDFKTLISMSDYTLELRQHGKAIYTVENALMQVGERQKIVDMFLSEDDNG